MLLSQSCVFLELDSLVQGQRTYFRYNPYLKGLLFDLRGMYDRVLGVLWEDNPDLIADAKRQWGLDTYHLWGGEGQLIDIGRSHSINYGLSVLLCWDAGSIPEHPLIHKVKTCRQMPHFMRRGV